MKPKITLRPLLHNNKDQIAIGFEYNDTVKAYVKGFGGVLWSKTHSTFYVLHGKLVLHNLFTYLQGGGYYVDYSAMRLDKQVPKEAIKTKKSPNKTDLYNGLTKSLQQDLKDFVSYMKGKRLSKSTINTYGYFILRFLDSVKAVKKDDLKTRHIELFMEQVIAKEYYSISSHRQCVSAFKHFTAFYKLPEFDASDFDRPKPSKYLPTVLSEADIIRLLQVTKNLKHRVIIGLLYSGGLRIGELIGLQLRHLDFDRNQVLIRQAKGRKDRVVTMSTVIKPLLINYITTYKPKAYLIEGRHGGMYSAVSIRQFLKRSCELAEITKPVTPHTLRHSYATHMLENGVDLRYIQELLGHAKPETTMIYTHVAQKNLMQIQNPLDVAVRGMLTSVKDNKKVSISGKNID